MDPIPNVSYTYQNNSGIAETAQFSPAGGFMNPPSSLVANMPYTYTDGVQFSVLVFGANLQLRSDLNYTSVDTSGNFVLTVQIGSNPNPLGYDAFQFTIPAWADPTSIVVNLDPLDASKIRIKLHIYSASLPLSGNPFTTHLLRYLNEYIRFEIKKALDISIPKHKE